MYSAQKWFDSFYNKFVQTRQQNERFGIKVRSQRYTQLMMNFIEELGKELGYKVKRERLTIDQFWKHVTKGTVALEHEISANAILKKELPNLMDVSSDLKVLITYVYDYQFPWEPDNIAAKVETEINAKYARQLNEFLLLIGTKTRRDQKDRRVFMQRDSDWFARQFYLGEVKQEILMPSLSRRARKARGRRRELCKHCGKIIPKGGRLKHLKDEHNIRAKRVSEHFDFSG